MKLEYPRFQKHQYADDWNGIQYSCNRCIDTSRVFEIPIDNTGVRKTEDKKKTEDNSSRNRNLNF